LKGGRGTKEKEAQKADQPLLDSDKLTRFGIALAVIGGVMSQVLPPLMRFIPDDVVLSFGVLIAFFILVPVALGRAQLARNRRFIFGMGAVGWVMLGLLAIISFERAQAHGEECAALQRRLLSPNGGERDAAIFQAMSCEPAFTGGLRAAWAR
jgi:hypothetical protein